MKMVKFGNQADLEFEHPEKARYRDAAEARKALQEAISKLPESALKSVVGFHVTVHS